MRINSQAIQTQPSSRANRVQAALIGGLPAHLRELWANRVLFGLWVRMNVQSRYSQAILGILWVVLLPLTTALVLAFAFSGLLRASVGDVPFFVFMFAAIVPWNLTNYGLVTSTRSIVGSMNLINQVYFPREILVLVTLGEGLIDALFSFTALVGIALLFGYPPNIHYLALPILLLIQLTLTLGAMFMISAGSVVIRDIPPLVAVAAQLFFFLTPILYPINTIPGELQFLIRLNPFAPLIQSYRDVILGRAPDFGSLVYPAVFAAVLLFSGYRFFKTTEPRFSDYL